MEEKDKEHKRFLVACFAMTGAIMRGDTWTPRQMWQIADDMLETEEPEETIGLPAIKRKAKVK